MKQLLQDARTGEVEVVEVPAPQLLPGCVIVRVAASLVSAGTERASSEFASKNLLAKAKARPDLVRDVLAKLRRDGVPSTVQAVRSRLDQPQSVGYSSAGVVIAVGDGITDINVGDRVACAGFGYAVHAEVACVPRLLVAKIPEDREVSFEEAAFGTVGAICLHGIRTAEVSLGQTVAVIGLGLLGQITVQLLRAAGCRVLGTDPVGSKVDLAIQSGAEAACTGAEEFRDLCFQKTGGVGVDSVLITAETPSSGPVNLAAELARDRAIVVAVGTVGMEIQRRLYYLKELDFRISRSYGPGRYDAAYEQKGHDYPIGHVRWTETRNMQAFVQLIAERKLNLTSLITHRFSMDDAPRAYDLITGKTAEPFLGVLIRYPESESVGSEFGKKVPVTAVVPKTGSIGLGVLGAGNFAQSILLPALKAIPEVTFIGVCNATGPRSRNAAEKFGFQHCTNSEQEILRDPDVHAVVIATRHNLHANQVLASLGASKAAFCEKPLCLTESELAAIVRAHSAAENVPMVMVGFNRRFAPMAIQLKQFLSEINEPLAIHYRVNAGYIPSDH
jgi:threonine dehydrogenase-like Zn-dependent dehydrogenase